MGVKSIRRIPTPEEVIAMFPMPAGIKKIKQQRDDELKDIFLGRSDKFLLIIGPCSADDDKALFDYVERLAKVEEQVRDKIFIIPRIYTNKPRTTGEGYKGMLHQPDPEKAPNMLEGILALRKMHVKAIEISGLTAADEMLYPENWVYVEDILSYVAIGARSVENQQHRLTVSGIDIPVGLKNPTSGDFSVLLNSIIAAQHGHTFIYRNEEVQTDGNPFAHAILRGSVNKHGQSIPNYHYEDVRLFSQMYTQKGLKNPMVIIDANHANSRKRFYEQPRIVKDVLFSRRYSQTVHDMVRGLMVESYIEEGNQSVSDGVYGKSITDGCLGWKDSETLIYNIADAL